MGNRTPRSIEKFAEDLSSAIAVPLEPPPNTPALSSKGPGNNKQLPQSFQNHSRVNTAIPMVNAGADEQKVLPPMKVAQDREGAKMAAFETRPLIQDLVKQAMTSAVNRGRLADEHVEHQKTASAASASLQSVPTEYALKLAAAVEEIVKQAGEVGPGEGPNALPVSSPKDGKSVLAPGQAGTAHQTPPMHPGMQKGLPHEKGETQMANTLNHPPPGGGSTKQAGLRDRLMKVAEDAIFPAHISAGPAVPPETSAAGEAGKTPAGGAPQGPTGLVGSNEAAKDYTKGQAYANRKADLKEFLTEPALSSATDTVLNKAFEHTGQAGVKISQALETPVQVAAARALLTKIAEEAKKEEPKADKKDDKKKESKEKDSALYC